MPTKIVSAIDPETGGRTQVEQEMGSGDIAQIPPTKPQLTAEELTDAFLDGSNRDKALGLVIADLVMQINPTLTQAQARTLVRDLFIHHFNNLS